LPSTQQPRGTIVLPAVFVWSASVLLLGIGLCLGILLVTVFRSVQHRITIQDSDAAGLPSVTIEGWRNGALAGSVRNGAVLVVGEQVAVTDGSGAFAVRSLSVPQNASVQAPPTGSVFVASKRGKKYYPVGSANADRLSPANKIYFPNAAAAEAAGYTR